MAEPLQVWIVDDDASMLWVLERALGRAGFAPRTFADGDRALAALAEDRPSVVVTDVRMPGTDGLSVASRIHAEQPDLPVVVMTAYSDLETTVAAFEGGAFEYLAKPFDLEDAVDVVRRACEPLPTASPAGATGGDRGSGDHAPDPAAAAPTTGPELVGQAPAMQELFRAIGRLARVPITVLITGESGTGKELVAQALHRHSSRSGGPFVALNMAAIPRELLESELFGHEKGAFTGAESRRQGRFEQASGGTLFLDEIGDMPAELQTRLLRVLAEGMFYRVGGSQPVHADVRILAATHQDLEARVANGDFREDLFHRLNVVRLPVPALRERSEDIPMLAAHFLDRAGRELGVQTKRLAPEAAERLMQLDWPGNVRQLENLCRWLTVMAAGREIRLEDLPAEVRGEPPEAGDAGTEWEAALRRWARKRIGNGDTGIAQDANRRTERVLLQLALEQTGGHRQEAARLLGWGRNTLTRKIRELDVDA